MKLTQDRLKEVLQYNPETGEFIWVNDMQNGSKKGSVAGSLNGYGYIRIGIDQTVYTAHRLIWLYLHGRWPLRDIDHINMVRHDNSLKNLREATRSENKRNGTAYKNNKSGFKGVYWRKDSRKWTAEIMVSGKSHFLGYFTTAEAAVAAHKAKAEEIHGEFARTE